MTEPAPLRGRATLRVAAVFALLTIAGFVVGVVVAQRAQSRASAFARVSAAAGSGQVHLQAGPYVAYFESRKVGTGTGKVLAVGVQLTDPTGHTTVLDTLYGGKKVSDATGGNDIRSLDYHWNGHDGVALYQFRITQSGNYRVQLAPPPGTPDDAKIAFGPSIAAGRFIGSGLVVLGAVLLLVTVVLTTVGLLTRRKDRRRRAERALYLD